ncbi:MAG TPA: FHA domain-containing protein [Geothrix sp.]|nr:FHA domain-containing protein [Geothrix sp.]
MPYLSWMEGNQPFRHAVVEDPCVLGRDSLASAVAQPALGTVSPAHAALTLLGGVWHVRDLESANGTMLNGVPVDPSQAHPLKDGDELVLGSWRMSYTEGFPGLDGVTFAERVGDLFDEIRLHPERGDWCFADLQQLYRATERLLAEVDSGDLERALLEESLRLTASERGSLAMRHEPGGWRSVHEVGAAGAGTVPPPSVLDYVAREHTAVLSNQPPADPRFEWADPLETGPGPFLCAPLRVEGQGICALYLEREPGGRPFSRLELATLQAFSRRGALVIHQARLQRRAIDQAEQQGELLRLRSQAQRAEECRGELFAAMAASFRRIQSCVQELPEAAGGVIRFQLERLFTLLDQSPCDDPIGAVGGHPFALAALQEELARRWASLLSLRQVEWRAAPPPDGAAWWPEGPLLQALDGLVEPLIMHMPRGAEVALQWEREPGYHVLRIGLPTAGRGAADGWSQRILREAGLRWRWADRALEVLLPEGPEDMPEEPARPLLGLVSEDLGLVSLFQTVAEAGDLTLHPLEAEPPAPPQPMYRFLVIDAKGDQEPEGTIRAYRRHPSFATTPILVVRCSDEDTQRLMEAGATDWLADGFRWETLHQRLRVLRGHTELRQRALAAERLESFRQMAGTLKHEINNPLAVISMQVEMLQRKYPEEAKLAKIGEMVDRIQSLVQVLQKMREAPTEGYADGSSILKLG